MKIPSFRRGPANVRHIIICILLALAATHCVESIFVDNTSFLDLRSYEDGTEQMPFQGRVAMIPIGRWAERSRVMQRSSDWFNKVIYAHKGRAGEFSSPSKVVYLGVGLLATLTAVGFGILIGRRHLLGIWWLPSSLYIYTLYVTYAARADARFWYPYDLPHFALFGMAALCLLEGWWIAAFCLFVVDLPVRETAVFLVPVAAALAYARQQWRKMATPAMMLILWAIVRIIISRHFASNPSDARIHWDFWARGFKNPYRFVQLASAFGFLLIPFIWGWKYLDREERFFVVGALPGILTTALYGIWYETRIWDDWMLPMGLLMSLQLARAVSRRKLSEFVVEERRHPA